MEATARTGPMILLRALSLPVLSLVIASLSLASSISQSYNYRKNIAAVQQNVLRAENLKTCRDIIEVFFAFRLRAEEANAHAARLDDPARDIARRDLKGLVYRFGALGTYLANFAPEQSRERYSALSWSLNEIADKATALPPADFNVKFTAADKAFGALNEDCVKSTQFTHL